MSIGLTFLILTLVHKSYGEDSLFDLIFVFILISSIYLIYSKFKKKVWFRRVAHRLRFVEKVQNMFQDPSTPLRVTWNTTTYNISCLAESKYVPNLEVYQQAPCGVFTVHNDVLYTFYTIPHYLLITSFPMNNLIMKGKILCTKTIQ